MSIETYITRGREIVAEVESIAKRKRLPVAKLEGLSEEWRGDLPTIIELSQGLPVEKRLGIQNYFMDVATFIDMPLFAHDVKKRKKEKRGKK